MVIIQDFTAANIRLNTCELRRLPRRPFVLTHGLAPDAIDESLAELAALVEPVEVHFVWRPQVRDPNDEMVLEAAMNGQADALIT